MSVADLISMTLPFNLIFPLFLYLNTLNKYWINVFVIGLLIETSTKYIKQYTIKKFPNSKWIYRPIGAFNCSAISTGGDASGKPGFPSGHMTNIAFIAVSLSLYYKSNIPLLAILLMAYARIHKKCHNIIQVLAGTLYGGIVAYGLFNCL
jgi:membrane-associated phospholipid phosphatase